MPAVEGLSDMESLYPDEVDACLKDEILLEI